MMLRYGLLKRFIPLLLLSATLFVSSTNAGFSFSWSQPIQCNTLTVTWKGGTGPYQLLFAPVSCLFICFLSSSDLEMNPFQKYKVPLNFSIPDSAYDSNKGQGSFSLTLNVSSQSLFLLVMSDSTGFGAGGVSSVLTVGMFAD